MMGEVSPVDAIVAGKTPHSAHTGFVLILFA